ncbi:MAG: site-specific DNA-methyltransferase [Armatimonadetes bacterium]|nr:site-specific DNA-methyltransferase [Armatimonadota bacterium]
MDKTQDIRMPLTSHSVVAERIAALRELFPEAFTEGAIDFAKLKQALGEFTDDSPERYGLSWAGKSEAVRAVQSLSSGTLVPCKEESVDFDTTENLIIEGDNLEVLKLLQKSYYGKVKMIYIDPPYNTGNEFIYPDNYREGLEDYLLYSGQVKDGAAQETVRDTSGRVHSKWLSMMYPRLFLARNLLSDDGVIFVSIDDHEVHNLRFLLDDIFGEDRFIAEFVWKSRQNKDNRNITGASIDHEYIVCYGTRIRGGERNTGQYSNPDNDPRGPWTSANMVGLATEDRRPNLHYDLIDPEKSINYGRPKLGWRYDQKSMARLIAQRRILWPTDPEGRPRRKAFLSELSEEFTGFSSIVGSGVYTRDGTAEIESLFGARVMDFPKPVALIKQLLEQTAGEDGTVLDFFAGSGTTAHAVFDINKNGHGKRRFILVQLPEPTPDESEARKAGYSTIAELCKERVRRAARNLDKESSGELNLDNTAEQDRGFKVLKLTSSNFKLWNADEAPKDADALAEQLKLYADHVVPGRSQEDILYELLIKAGLPLTAKIEGKEAHGQRFFSVSDGLLLICLEDEIAQETLREMIELKPEMVLCLDSAFKGNDQLKTNIVLEMESHEIKFRTV